MVDYTAINPSNLPGGSIETLTAMAAWAAIVMFPVMIALWVYTSFAYMAIARKNKQDSPGLAWIPGIGPLIVAFKASNMHWWPWLILIGFIIPIINFFATLAFTVVTIIWHWKMFEAIKKPGWWSILLLIPIVNLVIIGIAAWSKK